MQPDTPILMITLQIPVLADTSAEEVLDAIGQKVSEAIREIKQKQEEQQRQEEQQTAPGPQSIEQAEFKASVLKEALESYSERTSEDLLAGMGYKSRD